MSLIFEMGKIRIYAHPVYTRVAFIGENISRRCLVAPHDFIDTDDMESANGTKATAR